MDLWMDGCIGGWIYKWMDGWIYRWMDVCIGGGGVAVWVQQARLQQVELFLIRSAGSSLKTEGR